MSNTIHKNVLAALCTVAMLFAVAVGVDAQTSDPILDDEIICSIQSGDDLVIAPLSLQTELEAHLGSSATVESIADLLGRIDDATPNSSIRFEGCYPAENVPDDLANKGYETPTTANPELAGAASAVVYTI